MSYRKAYLGLGVFFTISTMLLVAISFIDKTSDFSMAISSQLSLAILSITIWNVYPDLKENDERAKKIKSKTLSTLSIFFIIFVVCLFVSINFFELFIDTFDILNILFFLLVPSFSISLIFFSKKY